jgi:hypothetical protein
VGRIAQDRVVQATALNARDLAQFAVALIF